MTKALHPGKHFAETIKKLDVTAYECAGAIGVRPPRIYDLAKCKTAISPALALRLARYLGGTAEHWLQLQARYDLDVAARELHDQLQQIHPHKRPRNVIKKGK
jgi:antitoxin HigA-1